MIKPIVYCIQQCLESVLLCDTCQNGEPVPFYGRVYVWQAIMFYSCNLLLPHAVNESELQKVLFFVLSATFICYVRPA